MTSADFIRICKENQITIEPKSNQFEIQIENLKLLLSSDFNKYCIIVSDKENKLISDFNRDIIFTDKSVINIVQYLLSHLKKNEEKDEKKDKYNFIQKIISFTKHDIDYNKLQELLQDISVTRSSNLKHVPKHLLLSKDQAIKTLINEVIQVNQNRNYKHYIIHDNNFTFTIKLVYDKLEVELKLIINPEYYPYTAPTIEYVKPHINISLLTAIKNMSILNKWSYVVSLDYFINMFSIELDKYIHDNLDTRELSDLDNNLMKLSILLKESSSSIEINIPVPIVTKTNQTNSYWKAGTGYGSSGDSEWDINSYIRTQELYKKEIISLLEIISKLINADNIDYIYDNSILLIFLKKQVSGLSLLEIQNNKNLYYTVFNMLSLFVITKFNQNIINTFANIINNIYEELHCVIDQFHDDEHILQIYNISDTIIKNRKQEIVEIVSQISSNIKDDYCNIMKPLQYQDCDINSSHNFYSNLSAKLTSETIRRIVVENAGFKFSLPLSWDSTVWVRTSKKNLNLFTFLISGPKDTPYENGLFEFHVCYNTNETNEAPFPINPPKVLFMTTGKGTWRANANLYANGKLCLSITNTWSGQSSEKWNKDTSSLILVMLGIQSSVLTEQPYFNEPGYERYINTERGNTENRKYNENLYPNIIKYTMIEQIKNPPIGYEEVVKLHFKMKKEEIMITTQKWIDSVKNKEELIKLRTELLDLINLIT